MSQYALYGSIAFATKRTAKYSQDVVNVIDTFFLHPSTKMDPNVNYGQMVRGTGPEGKKGTFTGVLDIRGIVKVINAILILKSGGSAEWTNSKDQDMRSWVSEYARWLEESDIGVMASTRPNNHVTFYTGQLAASKLYGGDKQGAIDVLQRFFKNEFRDQIAASGEQPFEGIRAKPLHYRSFNLEALIMNAKLGDALGIDLWSAKSKYKATIQTALDYAITCDPNGEDVLDLVPHVAAVSAAYGDPTGRYKSFLSKTMSNYESRPLWFYNQPSVFTKSPTSGKSKRGVIFGRDGDGSEEGDSNEQRTVQGGPVAGRPSIAFACPDAFKDAAKVEIDNEIYLRNSGHPLPSTSSSDTLSSLIMAEQAAAQADKSVQVKLVLLGEAAVGKSSVVLRFVNNEFQANKEPTIGAAFLTQKCRLEDRILRYEIWDTAGQERFHSLAPMYYRNAQAAVVVYDVTKASSLEKAKSWVKELQRQANPNIVIALAGNKVDLVQPSASSSSGASASESEDEADDATETGGEASAPSVDPESLRQVPREEAQAYATEAGLLFFETSAKTGEGVVEIFTEIAKKIPIEHILASARGNGGRPGLAANRAEGSQSQNVNLDQNAATKGKDACNC
ncbi:hypothetical protein EST38_g1062 [Candolleomyces aberdarensis]|uniref:Alginate lyase domain-containing protein n=1 Tax=Candolleomyces aberdarensis TaxID=2316362 RepID=A0A4Q2E0F3_9AGAR|nr:hypothetical protein EST38_g1062 [Candolleomyces aberdarensis]